MLSIPRRCGGWSPPISRYLGDDEDVVLPLGSDEAAAPLSVESSRPIGAAWLLDGLWRQLDIAAALREVLGPRRFRADIERVIFALVANRAIAPASKLAAAEWVSASVVVPGLDAMDKDQAMRAMDLLVTADARGKVSEAVFFAAAQLLNLEVDLIFFDSTTTYFERDDEPEPDENGQLGLRRFGHSKDHRKDLPQIVIGLAVTREGIPVRCWVWPGNTTDMTVIEQVKNDLADWRLGRVVTVADSGFSSRDNMAYLQRGGGHYIMGVKMREGSAQAREALSRQGRYQQVRDNLRGQGSPTGLRPRPAVDHLPQPDRGRPRQGAPRRTTRRHHHRTRTDYQSPCGRAEIQDQQQEFTASQGRMRAG